MSGWQSASSEQSCRNRSSLAELCSGPIPSYLIHRAVELVIVEMYRLLNCTCVWSWISLWHLLGFSRVEYCSNTVCLNCHGVNFHRQAHGASQVKKKLTHEARALPVHSVSPTSPDLTIWTGRWYTVGGGGLLRVYALYREIVTNIKGSAAVHNSIYCMKTWALLWKSPNWASQQTR